MAADRVAALLAGADLPAATGAWVAAAVRAGAFRAPAFRVAALTGATFRAAFFTGFGADFGVDAFRAAVFRVVFVPVAALPAVFVRLAFAADLAGGAAFLAAFRGAAFRVAFFGAAFFPDLALEDLAALPVVVLALPEPLRAPDFAVGAADLRSADRFLVVPGPAFVFLAFAAMISSSAARFLGM